MGRRGAAGALLGLGLWLAVAPVQAQFQGENLLVSMPAGFNSGYQDTRNGMSIQEWVPEGETVQNWSEMVTVQVFHDRRDLDPRAMLDSIQRGWLKACAGSAAAPIVTGKVDGYDTAAMVLRCPLNGETGKPETTAFRAIKGRDSFYVIQRALRSVPDASARPCSSIRIAS
ncbi:MAG: hypothetical protein JO339_35300 [Alphaproteobacteria bacterium]|nr:hypothetical protein [Alphaproteobacteria bacterium]